MNLIKELEQFLQNEPVKNQALLLEQMTHNIGSSDSYLRDELIYRAYCKLVGEGYLNQQQLQLLMEYMLNEGFFHYKLGEQHTDSVFQRSFSALVIALLLEYDVTHHIFERGLVEKATEQAIFYMMNEKDYRGYVEDKGWAHAVAHGADVLDAIAKHHYFNNLQRLLRAIEIPLLSGHPFIDDEEERLAVPVFSLLKYKDTEEEIVNWLTTIVDHTNTLLNDRSTTYPYRVLHTVKHFLKALYFYLKFKGGSEKVQQKINESLNQWTYL